MTEPPPDPAMGPAPGTLATDADPTEEWRPPPAWTRWEIWAVAIVIAVAAILRFHDYTLAPTLADNQDPLQFAWAGLTLITRHSPTTWDLFQAYHYDFVLQANGTTYYITHPWLSHPPLFYLLVGGWAYLLGARELTDVTAEMVRPVAIVLGLISLGLTYALARRVLGSRAAIVGLVLLAVTPGAVLLGREVETEALLTPLLLLVLILLHRQHSGEGGRLGIAVILACCVLMPLVKVTGVVLAGALTVVLLASGRWRLAAGTLLSGAAGIGLFVAYGALFDLRLFLDVLAEWQTYRHGIMAGYEFIVDSAGIGRSFRDGWWHLGWIALAAIIIRGRAGPRPMLLATIAVVYAAGIAVLGDVLVQGHFGWYRIVLLPLVYSAAGYLVWESIKRPSIPGTLLMLVLGGATAAVMVGGSVFNPNAYLLAGVVAAGVLPAAMMLWRRESETWRRVAQASTGTMLALVVLASIVESWNLARIYTQI